MKYFDTEFPAIQTGPSLKIEAVVVCNRYHDFLSYTLPHNKQLFDKLVVVTSKEDLYTQKLCEYYHVEVVATDVLRTKEHKFCKGAGINEGLSKLSNDGWVIHMDADILLPPQTKILLQNANLEQHMIYGIDRFIVKGPYKWHEFLEHPVLQHEAGSWIHTNNSFPLGTRVMQVHFNGYVPIGFFQMWCPKVSKVHKYPEGHTTAGREDVLFSTIWPRYLRSFIPEVIGYHLESEDSKFSINWNGRKSAPFKIVKRNKLWGILQRIYRGLKTMSGY